MKVRATVSTSPPLFAALAESLERQIHEGVYKAGEKLPSLREIAALRSYGKNTVISAFELLVSRGLVEPRRGSGFFVKEGLAAGGAAEDNSSLHRAMDIVWLMRMQLRNEPGQLTVGDAFPPSEWLAGARLDRIHHKVARGGLGTLFRYGDRLGYAPLRHRLVRHLAHLGLDASPQQIVLTHGANEAMDLIVRYFVPPGAVVLIDDPGYYPLLGKLHLVGARTVGVPRLTDGPDLQALERLLKALRPRVFFTQSLAHNPTGSDLSRAKAKAMLRLAEQHNLLLVENDALSDFRSAKAPRLSALDQLERTLYVGSFSKSLSAALRVGFVACSPDLANDLANLKILTGVSSSEYAERTVDTLLAERHHARHLEQLREKLAEATQQAYDLLDTMGARVFVRPQHSLFIWARWPEFPDAQALAQTMLAKNIVMAPGNIFSVNSQVPSPWSRCNPHAVLDPRFRQAFDQLRR
ncbi:transcriptional regulator, GntR family with aminotransferase domain [Acidovorax delafieldii 2AN]|jgi:DNA-binding transcriptional MocR family regulator|uniref:Transcriptional regulator, GntR family with aminotransferase domain n=1 Tax=Acidovorax delafieldii 2AN TaxID=573060 RepID=C5SZG5_ACIDE|nr:PLP-dependent aminotransferase family protein [Acidovorax delafieldii]EER62361.1 transcriptional regulator, GntR family with aminotransferase domain [Acidovorax delafieldii 2AN]